MNYPHKTIEFCREGRVWIIQHKCGHNQFAVVKRKTPDHVAISNLSNLVKHMCLLCEYYATNTLGDTCENSKNWKYKLLEESKCNSNWAVRRNDVNNNQHMGINIK